MKRHSSSTHLSCDSSIWSLVDCFPPGLFTSFCTPAHLLHKAQVRPRLNSAVTAVRGGFVFFAFSSRLGLRKDHPADRRPSINIYFTVTSTSSGSCFASPFIPLSLRLLFFGAWLSSLSFRNLFLLFLHKQVVHLIMFLLLGDALVSSLDLPRTSKLWYALKLPVFRPTQSSPLSLKAGLIDWFLCICAPTWRHYSISLTMEFTFYTA